MRGTVPDVADGQISVTADRTASSWAEPRVEQGGHPAPFLVRLTTIATHLCPHSAQIQPRCLPERPMTVRGEAPSLQGAFQSHSAATAGKDAARDLSDEVTLAMCAECLAVAHLGHPVPPSTLVRLCTVVCHSCPAAQRHQPRVRPRAATWLAVRAFRSDHSAAKAGHDSANECPGGIVDRCLLITARLHIGQPLPRARAYTTASHVCEHTEHRQRTRSADPAVTVLGSRPAPLGTRTHSLTSRGWVLLRAGRGGTNEWCASQRADGLDGTGPRTSARGPGPRREVLLISRPPRRR